MHEPSWLSYGREFLGLKEIPGIKNEPVIVQWWQRMRSWFRDDETPWCGLFVAICMSECGIKTPPTFFRALSWKDWGFSLPNPEVGCVVVFSRTGGGHVGFVVGEDQNGNLMVLGGNQGNRVSIVAFPRDRVVGYRWPVGQVLIIQKLPVYDSGGKISINEA